MGWNADMRAVLFCCLTLKGNIKTLVSSVKRIMVQP